MNVIFTRIDLLKCPYLLRCGSRLHMDWRLLGGPSLRRFAWWSMTLILETFSQTFLSKWLPEDSWALSPWPF